MPWGKNFDVQQTLGKAMRAFWSRGYEATSVQDLLEEMGINRGSMYGTFGDKRSLFMAALQKYDEEFRKAQLAVISHTHSGKAAIRALFDGWIVTVLGDKALSGCFLTNTALELAAHDPEIGSLVATSQRGIEQFFRRHIKEGQTRGEIPARHNPSELARVLLSMLAGLLVLGRSRPEPKLLHAVVKGAMAALS